MFVGAEGVTTLGAFLIGAGVGAVMVPLTGAVFGAAIDGAAGVVDGLTRGLGCNELIAGPLVGIFCGACISGGGFIRPELPLGFTADE